MGRAAAMTMSKRIDNYVRMNGTVRLTRRQARRCVHKQNRAAAPFGKKAA